MRDELADLVGLVDGPRPLPVELRDRLSAALLHEVLLAETGRQPDTDVHFDPDLADLDLDEVDAPRPLPASVRARLHEQLATSGTNGRMRAGGRRRLWAGAAAAAVVAGAVAVTLTVGQSTGTPPAQQAAVDRQPTPTSTPRAPAGRPPHLVVNGPLHRAPSPVPSAAPKQRLAPDRRGQDRSLAGTSGSYRGSALDALVRPVSLSPRRGPVAGGNTVVLRGRGLGQVRGVRFDGVEATGLRASAQRVQVVAPAAQEAGPVVVTLLFAGPGRVQADQHYIYEWWDLGPTDWW